MPSHDRRAAARRRAWGRGPMILQFESLEGRLLLTTNPTALSLPDLAASAFSTAHNLYWGDSFHAAGAITNEGQVAAGGAFHVDIYASTTPILGATAVKLGEVTIPAGLAPGQTSKFDQVVTLPNTPIPGLGSSQTIAIGLRVDPENLIAETNKNNNQGLGVGFDTSVVTLTPHTPASLIGTSLGAAPGTTAWGSTFEVTAQISNNSAGAAPATRARLVLTPAGQTPSPGDVTIGNIAVPPIAAYKTINVSQLVTLPAGPPSALAGSTQYTLTMMQDADFVLSPIFPGPSPRGTGLDQTPIQIKANPAASAANTSVPVTGNPTSVPVATTPNAVPAPPLPLPDLAASTVVAPTQPLAWGQSFPVTATVQNLGGSETAAFNVRFLLVGASGSFDHAIILGNATVGGLTAGASQDVTQTVKLPGWLPNGVVLNSTGIGRIAVVIDPENTIDEAFKTNNTAESGPVTLRVLGTDGNSTVPTLPATSATKTTTTTTAQTTPAPAPAPAPAPRARNALQNGTTLKARRAVLAHQKPTLSKQWEHKLTVFPKQVGNYFKDLFKKSKP